MPVSWYHEERSKPYHHDESAENKNKRSTPAPGVSSKSGKKKINTRGEKGEVGVRVSIQGNDFARLWMRRSATGTLAIAIAALAFCSLLLNFPVGVVVENYGSCVSGALGFDLCQDLQDPVVYHETLRTGVAAADGAFELFRFAGRGAAGLEEGVEIETLVVAAEFAADWSLDLESGEGVEEADDDATV